MSEPTEQQVDHALEVLMKAYEEKAFSAEDRKHATIDGYKAFRHLLRQRLLSDKPLPTVAECEGMVILALDFLTCTPGRPESPYGRGQF